MIIEFIFGWIAKSLALMTDALHLFTDAASILLSLFAFWIVKRPSKPHLTYGYYRVEILCALLSGALTWILSGILIYEAIHRFYHPEDVVGPLVLIVASVGLLANLLMLRILHPVQKGSLNVKGAYLHILGDLLTSLGVVIGGLLITVTQWNIIDPIMTLVVAVAVIYNAWKLILETLLILMESAPKNIKLSDVKKKLLTLPHIESLHDLHIWMVALDQINLSVHLISNNALETLKETNCFLQKEYNIYHSTIQIEPTQGYNCPGCTYKKSH